MRADRIRNLWPLLEPKLRIVAKAMLQKYDCGHMIDVEEVLPEAIIAIKKIKSTRKHRYNLSYLIHRGRIGIARYLFSRQILVDQEIQLDSALFI